MPTYQRTSLAQAVQMTTDFEIDTPRGKLSGKAGDYLVDEDGEQILYRKEVFEKKYIETDESKQRKRYTYEDYMNMAKGYVDMGAINKNIANGTDEEELAAKKTEKVGGY